MSPGTDEGSGGQGNSYRSQQRLGEGAGTIEGLVVRSTTLEGVEEHFLGQGEPRRLGSKPSILPATLRAVGARGAQPVRARSGLALLW